MRYPLIALALFYMALSGEVTKAQEADSIRVVETIEQPIVYTPFYGGNAIIHPHEKSGSLSGDFKRALQSESLIEAREKWEDFLKHHDSEEYEDGFHANHVRHAKFELMRVLYLLDEVEQADKIIIELSSLSIQ